MGLIRVVPLTGSFAGKYDVYRPVQDVEVEPKGPVVDVVYVRVDPFLEAQGVTARHLPQAGNAGLVLKDDPFQSLHTGNLGDGVGTWSDQAEVPDQYVPELR